METINNNPLIIYDGAHNEPVIRNFQNSINMYYKDSKRRCIVSILRRKDYDKMIQILLEDENAILTQGNDEARYAPSEELYEIAMKYKKQIKKFINKIYLVQ